MVQSAEATAADGNDSSAIEVEKMFVEVQVEAIRKREEARQRIEEEVAICDGFEGGQDGSKAGRLAWMTAEVVMVVVVVHGATCNGGV